MKKALAIILALTISIELAACTTANSTPSDVETSNGELKIGDYILLGKYNDEPILWRYVVDDENGKMFLSDKILCVKFYDIGYNNEEFYGTDLGVRNVFGNNYWKTSS